MKQIIESNNLKWIDIKGPTENDLKWLKDNFNLHPLVLNQLLPRLDFPKVENFGDYIFLVLFYPSYNIKTKSVTPLEVDLIISPSYVITNHYQDVVPLRFIFNKCNLYNEQKQEYFKDGSWFLSYHIVRKFLTTSFPKLKNVKEEIANIENDIFNKNDYAKTVVKIATLQRDLIGFQKIIEPHEFVLMNFVQSSAEIFNKQSQPYFKNLVHLFKHIENIASNSERVLKTLDETNQSLLNTRTNEIIKILTIFSVIVFPLNLFASLFGMNTHLPIVKHEYSFWIVLGIMGAGALFVLAVFKAKKWI